MEENNVKDRLIKATEIDEVYTTFKYRPLFIHELDKFYIENENVRGGRPARKRISRTLEKEIDDYQHILLVGYKGTGKSTELNYLQREKQNENYLVINYSVMKELDPLHLNYIELFIVTMEQLFALADKNNLVISKEYLKNIQLWLQSKEIINIKEKYNIGVEGEAGLDGSIGIPYLHKFFYKFKMSAKSSRSLKETIKTNIEPKLSELIEHCNLLIKEIKLELLRVGKKDLLVIIEDLDKIPIDRAEDVFFNYANQITSLECNIIFTFPITSYFNIRFNTIRQYFTEVLELPMIKVKNRDQSVFQEGVDTLKRIVERRMDMQLFEREELLDNLIEKCGGCIRDLFRLIAEAAENAIDYNRKRITKVDCDNSIVSLKKDYRNTIADKPKDEEIIKAETYYKVLVKIAKSVDKIIDNTEETLDLRQNLCLLGYNGEGWCDVHPIVKDILIERKLWDGKQDK